MLQRVKENKVVVNIQREKESFVNAYKYRLKKLGV